MGDVVVTNAEKKLRVVLHPLKPSYDKTIPMMLAIHFYFQFQSAPVRDLRLRQQGPHLLLSRQSHRPTLSSPGQSRSGEVPLGRRKQDLVRKTGCSSLRFFQVPAAKLPGVQVNR